MLTKIPSGVRRKVIPTMLQVNVPNIRPRSVNVRKMTIISNAIRSNGVPITVIIPRPVLCRPLLTDNARTVNLITKAVKKTDRGPVVNLVMSIPVLRDGCMQPQTGVLMIILTANAVPLLLLPDVRAITAFPVPAVPTVKTPADTPATDVVTTLVRGAQKSIIPEAKPERPNAEHNVITVKTVHQEVRLIPVLMSVLPNAEAVMHVPITAVPDRSLFPAPLITTKCVYLLRNAEPGVILASITPIVP